MSRKLPILLFTLTMILVLAACGSNTGTTGSGSTTGTTGEASTGTELSGSVLAVGSTALQPLVDQVAQKFMADSKYANVSVQVQGGGSGTGLTQVSEGQANIGNSDVFAEEKLDADKAKELVDHQVAVVAIATVANEAAGVTNLTKQQLVDIFTGKVKNWKDVGGKDQAIVIVNRPSSSGTRATYEKFALGQKVEDLAGSIQEDSSGTVKKLVTETPGAIGYLALSYLDDSLKAIQYDGVDASVENVESGKYPVWAYEHMYTKGEPDAATKALLDYMLTDEVQNGDVKDLGYISISGMQVKRDVEGKITK
ncbi:phosphate ABC transporter substrate-binding protein [Paenibacillus sp. PK4536]|jgi:phosphate transport system substrate-binding protein|uniref:Phosphate-binding protein n=2 Tax=Bacillales TaxID=1385 RepID=A0A1E3L3B8_9BACL|nr:MULTISPECIES: phosphate ABC transporter substrate-binding protein [Paenibacillus]ODP28312.1 Phosphate-binding protein PstS [Paenibacillus nuruki]TKJ91053.1 phosphate ABC transporter substrate-binding protein [Paenibacillus sp. CFBP13512]WIM39944.1 phosphate ABC transporter substrate-binding protein [Paenibacillus sp. PK4536]CAJ1317714.1 Phosphate-binding protein [Paenibacillus nuruki]